MALSEEHIRGLGRVTANFAALEHYVNSGIWTFFPGHHHEAQVLTAQLSFSRALDALASLMLMKLDTCELSARLTILIQDARHLEEERNQLLHSMWLSDDSGVVSRLKISARPKKGLLWARKHVPAEHLHELADRIKHTAQEILTLLHESAQAATSS